MRRLLGNSNSMRLAHRLAAWRCGARVFATLAIVIGIVWGQAAPVVAQSNLVGARLLSDTNLARVGLKRAWWGQAIMNPLRDRVEFLTLDDQTLYVQSSNGVVTAFDNETGRKNWATQVCPANAPQLQAAQNEQYLLVVGSNTMYALNKSSGDIAWHMGLPGAPTAPPAMDELRLYLGTLDGSFYAFDLVKILKLHQQQRLVQYGHTALLWRYKTSKTITSPAVPYGAYVTFASQNGSLYSVSGRNRELIYQFETDSKVAAPLVRYGSNVLVASDDFNFYSVGITSGRQDWQYSVGTPTRRPPVVVKDEVYLMPERGGMFKINPANGDRYWWNPKGKEFLSVSPNRLYARDYLNNMLILDRNTGGLIGYMPLDTFTVSLSNDRSDRVYLASKGGSLVCFYELNRDFPAFHNYGEKQPIFPVFGTDGDPDEAQPTATP